MTDVISQKIQTILNTLSSSIITLKDGTTDLFVLNSTRHVIHLATKSLYIDIADLYFQNLGQKISFDQDGQYGVGVLGLGIQTDNVYVRTINGFNLFVGGVHSDIANDPGLDGYLLLNAHYTDITDKGLSLYGNLGINTPVDSSYALKVIGNTNIAGDLTVSGNINIVGDVVSGTTADVVNTSVQMVSTLPTGTSPISVVSTTVNTNFNADLLDGKHAADFLLVGASLNASNLGSGTIPTARLPAFTGGDVTSPAGSLVLTLKNSGVTAGTYNSITVNAKGLVTAGSTLSNSDATTLNSQPASYYLNATNLNAGTLNAARLPAFTGGDITSPVGSLVLTLKNSGVVAGTYTSLTVNTKGLVTAASNAPITLTGRLNCNTFGFLGATKDNISVRVDSGFWQTASPTLAEGWPVNSAPSWYHLLTSTHTNDANYYSMQFAASFIDSNELYFRCTNNNGLNPWNKMWHAGNVQTLATALGSGIIKFDGIFNSLGMGGIHCHGTNWGSVLFTSDNPAVTTGCGFHYGANPGDATGNQLRVGRYNKAGTAWLSNPFTFYLDNSQFNAALIRIDQQVSAPYLVGASSSYNEGGEICLNYGNQGAWACNYSWRLDSVTDWSTYQQFRIFSVEGAKIHTYMIFDNIPKRTYLGYFSDGGGSALTIDANPDNLSEGYLRFYRRREIATEGILDCFSNWKGIYTNVFRINCDGSFIRAVGRLNDWEFSDYALKEHIVDATAKLPDLLKLKIRNFNFKGLPDKQLGFIAQEVQQIFPSLVGDVTLKGKDDDDNQTYKAVREGVLLPITIKAVQEMYAELVELRNRVSTLEGRKVL